MPPKRISKKTKNVTEEKEPEETSTSHKILDLVDRVKTKLSDSEYIDLVNSLKTLHVEEKKDKWALYTVSVLSPLIEGCKTTHGGEMSLRFAREKMVIRGYEYGKVKPEYSDQLHDVFYFPSVKDFAPVSIFCHFLRAIKLGDLDFIIEIPHIFDEDDEDRCVHTTQPLPIPVGEYLICDIKKYENGHDAVKKFNQAVVRLSPGV